MILSKNGSIYERELKGIFAGEEQKLETIGWLPEVMKERILQRPFLVIRAAGSHGYDIIVIRDDISLPVEIKSSKEKVINFSSSSKRSQIQAESYLEILKRTKIMPIYAFRLKGVKGDPWRIFTFSFEFGGRYRLLSEIIPKIEITKAGSFILKWESGLPLTSLLEYLF